MLSKLSIRNFALIDHAELTFKPGFTVITGETGSGKSILLGALSLILGQRADLDSVLDTTKKCIIEGHLELNKTLRDFFEQHDLDWDTTTIVRRELLPSGKSRAFINDTPVTLLILAKFMSQLIDLHQQHKSLHLATSSFQRKALDSFAGLSNKTQAYSQRYRVYQQKKNELAALIQQEQKNTSEKDFIQYQFDELAFANIESGELEYIEKSLHKANHYEELVQRIQQLNELSDGDHGAIKSLRLMLSEIRKLSTINEHFQSLEKRVESILIELEDISEDLKVDEHIEIDNIDVDRLTERYDLLNRLLNKHRLHTDWELIELQVQFQQQLNSFDTLSEKISIQQKEVAELKRQLKEQANYLSKERRKNALRFEEEVVKKLSFVGMPKSVFSIRLAQTSKLNEFGHDEIDFLFSANPGSPPKLIKQVASGGELSRLMLSIKSIIASTMELQTMIFDEIDTGISGEIAKKVGRLLQELSMKYQLISITHLPQIAAKANHHFKVEKLEQIGHNRTRVYELTEEQKIEEIAEMLSGKNPSKSSLEAAKELMTS